MRFASFIGVIFLPFVLAAQQNNAAWTNIGPSPAAVEALAVDQQGSGAIFMGTISGGVRKSLNGGSTWSVVNSGLTTPIVQALAMDASGAQTVYAGTIGGGLFKSTDGGVTWKNLPAISGSVASIATDPKRPGVLYAGVFNNLANGAIRKSMDGGVTWTTVFPSTASIFNITIDPGNTDILYAPTVGHGAFKSTDGGQHWAAMSALTPQAIWTLAMDPTNSQILYAGTDQDGVWTSTDAGTSWVRHLASGLPGLPVYSLAVDASSAHTVYAGTNGAGVWISADGGATWKSSRLGDAMILSLAIDSAGALYAGTNSAGAQVSRDHGATWTILNTGVEAVNKLGYGIWIDPRNNQKILVGDEAMYGLIWSQDGGANWTTAGQGFTGRGSRSVAFDPTDSRRVYASGLNGTGFFKSTDGGLTWLPRQFGTAAVYAISVAVDPSTPNILYAGTQNEGFFKSTDYGDSWKSTGSGLSGAITFLTVDPTKSGRLFACTATSFYLSEDGGATWANVLNTPAWTVTIDPGRPSIVYATGRTQGAFRSSDGGRTWQSINNGLSSLTMGASAAVIIDPTNSQGLYVGGAGGVFKSLDGGDHWFAVNAGLTDLSVSGLAMDPANSSVLYACGPSGIFKTLTGAEVQSASIAISAVVNGASLLAGGVAPGEIVVLTGSGLGPGQLVLATAGANGVYNSQLSGTNVQFSGTPAPVIYTWANQVAVQVPDSLPVGPAQIAITYEGRTSAQFAVQVTQYAPGVFTLSSTGSGQAVVLNQDGSVNSVANMAKIGDVVSLYGTGLRQDDGQPTVMIGGGQAVVISTGNLAPGVLQINARIPGAIQTGGTSPIVVTVGNSSSQAGVTIAIQAASPAGTATNGSIGWASAVTTDSAGNVYFVSSNSVFKVDPQGALTRIAGTLKPGYSGDGGPATAAQLYTDHIGIEEPEFGFPSGLATDSKGNLYISDGGNARIRRVSTDGIITTVAGKGTHGSTGDGGPATVAQISAPRGLSIDAAGNLYIADSAAVRMVSAAGVISTAAPFGGAGVAIDRGGNLYVADYNRIRRVSPAGVVAPVAGGTGIIGDTGDGGPATSAALIGPTALAIDSAGNVYIGDVSRVRRVSPDGIISTSAGGGKNDPGDGGLATNAQIAVLSIAIDRSDNLYIAGYARVRKVSTGGTITTVAGNGN